MEILGEGSDEEAEEDDDEAEDEEDGDNKSDDDDDETQKNLQAMQTQMEIKDATNTDTVNLRRTIYLSIMSSVDFEECAHKLMKISLAPGQEVNNSQIQLITKIIYIFCLYILD